MPGLDLITKFNNDRLLVHVLGNFKMTHSVISVAKHNPEKVFREIIYRWVRSCLVLLEHFSELFILLLTKYLLDLLYKVLDLCDLYLLLFLLLLC